MLYPNLKFSKPSKGRPFFYTNFVQTIDGKAAVKKEGYWPIGSKKDYEVLTELRSYADCLIHGGNLARQFEKITLKSINKRLVQQTRRVNSKSAKLPYFVITKHPKTLGLHLSGVASIFSGNLQDLVEELNDEGYKHVLVEGGPTLLGSFLKEGLMDEIFLTIAPKIYGNEAGKTLTLVEGYLFPKIAIKKLSLLSVKKLGSEIYLRYKVITR